MSEPCPLSVDRYTCRTPHFNMHSHCTALRTGVQTSRTCVAQVIKGFCSQNIHTSSLRATSHALTHSTLSTFTPSSLNLIPRSLIYCEDQLPPQGGASAELPRPTGYDPNQIVANRIVDNQIVDDQENMHFTEDDQITELEDRVKPLSYNQSFLASSFGHQCEKASERHAASERIRRTTIWDPRL